MLNVWVTHFSSNGSEMEPTKKASVVAEAMLVIKWLNDKQQLNNLNMR